MSWHSWSDFWAMGGYGLYVWGSYGLTLALGIAEVLLLCSRRRAALEQARRVRAQEGASR